MANGYCPSILAGINSVGLTDPSKKLRTLGFLQMLLCCMDGSVQAQPLQQGLQGGHTRGLSVWYRNRIPESKVADGVNACDNAITSPRLEFTIPNLVTKSISTWIPNSLIRQYCKDASDPVTLNGAPTPVMREVYDILITAAGALLAAIDTTLVTQMSTQFGVNVTTGNNAAEAITYDPSDKLMLSVVRKLVSEWRDNEFCDNPCIVGNGAFADFEFMRKIFANVSADGIDGQAMQQYIPRVWFDKATTTIWGANQIGVFEQGSVAFLSAPRFVGMYAGRQANTEKFTMILPVDQYSCPPECLNNLVFDVQIREIDCPQQIHVDGVANTTVEDGVQVTISKDFYLFVKPGTLYAAGDPLAGGNGTLRYSISEAAASK